MATKSVATAVADEKLVSAIVALVMTLPRGKDKDGKEYTGIRQDRSPITELFFAVMARLGHPLSAIRNADCNHEHPCKACRRDVYESAVNQAVELGKIIRQGRSGRAFTDDRGRQQRSKGFVMFYRPGEVSSTVVSESFMDELLAKLCPREL